MDYLTSLINHPTINDTYVVPYVFKTMDGFNGYIREF